MIGGREIKASNALILALWATFALPEVGEFDPDPDPQKVLELAEDANADGI